MTIEVLATRGLRLGLGRTRWVVADSDVGPSETGSAVWIIEVDDQDRVRSMVLFDVDDRDALDDAYAELDARFAELSAQV